MALLPPPDIVANYVDEKGKPSKDFFNWIRSLYAAVLSGGGAGATPSIFYVRADGDDTAGDGTSGKPFSTLQKAIDVAVTYDANGTDVVIDIGEGTFNGATVTGPLRGGIQEFFTRLIISGAGKSGTATPTVITDPGAGNAGTGVYCFLANGTNVAFQGVDIAIPTGMTGVYLQNYAYVTPFDMTMTGADATTNCFHAESFSYIEFGGFDTPCDLYGEIGSIFSLDTGRIAFDSGVMTFFCPVGSLAFIDNLSLFEINSAGAFVLGAGGSPAGTIYNVIGNSKIVNYGGTDYTTTVWSDPGVIENGGRTSFMTAAPTVVSTTGLGSGNASVNGSSYGGTITLSPAGGPSGSGTVKIDLKEISLQLDASTPAACTVSPQNDSAAWNGLAVARVTDNPGDGTITIAWQNGTAPTALTAGQTYKINYVCNN